MSVDTDDCIAIVGMSGRFPGSPDIPSFWRSLVDGRESITQFTDEELLAAGIPAEVLRHPNYVKAGSYLEDVELFDAAFFGVSPREAELMDPQQRLFLEHAWLALEDAGIAPARFLGQIAVFGGASFSTYGLLNLRSEIGSTGALETVLGNDKDYLATRVSYKLGLRGPSVSVQTACSTSLTAVAMACDSLLNLQADVALAGGVTVKLPLKTGYLYEEGSILSPDGHCRTFDAKAQGTIFGSGVGIVALKRLADALADGDPIHAVIRGWSVNNDGDDKVGFTAPSVDGQARVIASALAQAGVAPETIGYVEAHGTATPIGDPIEVRALTQAYGDGSGRAQPCGIGSVKTNVGHLESAAGVTGLIKAALAVKLGVVPASLHFETPNPEIDFGRTPFRVVDRLTPWSDDEGPRRAAVNSFGMGGTNVHVIVEQPPAGRPRQGGESAAVDRTHHLVPLSSRSEAGLREAALKLAERLNEDDAAAPGDVAYTMAARQPFPTRLAVQGRTVPDIAAALQAFAEGGDEALRGDVREGPPDTVFLFTGQGAQYARMGRNLYDTSPRFRATLDRCDALLRPHLDRPLLQVMFPAAGEDSLVDETAYTQPALFSLSFALADLWRAWGLQPTMLLGHSVGEFAAAAVAGVFSLEDGLALIAARGRLMQALPRDGLMMTVFAAEDAVRAAVEPHAASVSVAAVNGDASTVISGSRAEVEAIAAAFERRGVRARALTTSHAFHSPLMRPVVGPFRAIAARVQYRMPDLPILSNVTGRLEREALAGADYWCEHILAPVRFRDGIRAAVAAGANAFVEMGPRPVLCGLGREAVDGGAPSALHWLPSLTRAGKDWPSMLDTLGRLYCAGAPIDWAAFDAGHARTRLRLPGYAFQRRRFWSAPKATGDGPVRGVGTGETHPLLGQRLRQAGTRNVRYEAIVGSGNPAYLGDHRVFNAAVLPAAAYLEMALAGGARLLSAQLLTLENVQFKQAMTLPEEGDRIVQTLFSPAGPRELGFQIFSGTEDGDDWTLHCSGTVRPAPIESPVEDLDDAQARCEEPLPVDLVYANYRSRGLDYGPAFRGIRALRAGAGETLAHIVLPAAAGSANAYHLHPALSDACFQALGAAFGARDDRDTFLPVTLRRLTLHAPAPDTFWCHAQLLGRSEGPDPQAPGDQESRLRLFDGEGRLAVEIDGLQSRRVTRDVVLQSAADAVDNWLYDVVWEPAETAATTVPFGRGRWVVVDGGTGAAAPVAAAITERGGRAVAVSGEDLGQALAAGPIAGVADLRAVQPSGQSMAEGAEQAAGDLLELVQAMAAADLTRGVPLAVVTCGAQGGIDAQTGVRDLAAASLWGLVRTVWHEFPEMPCLSLDLDPAAPLDVAAIVDELASIGSEQQVAHRDGGRLVTRLRRHEADRGRIDLPSTPYRIDKAPEHGLDRLAVLPLERRRPAAGEVELEVVGMGLNFRDVLNAMGLYPGEAGPFGGECSGRVVRVGPGVADLRPGDEVVALHYGTFASHVTLPAAVVFKAPANMPLVEAAGLPIVYLTAWYGLHHLAGIKTGDKVLIHSATGGVGLAAIRIAQMAGAEIYATASPQKHDLLRSLGIRHVMNSRTVDFAADIMAATAGQGVDIVLNSLGGDAIPASLSVVKPGGHFVEIGKRDIWTVEAARAERPDIAYAIVNFDETAVEEPQLVRSLLAGALKHIDAGDLGRPITSVYPAREALDAMRLMQKARHIGKLVLAAPQPGERGQDIRSDATYLVTGAFGGIGRLIAPWLAQRGARHFALVGRRTPDADIEQDLAVLRAAGADVRTFAADIADRSQVDQLLQTIAAAMPPLRGIIHAAGVLDDGVVTALDRQRIARAFSGKVRGAWHLHEATRDREIDLFVMFSSLGSLLGAPGQANYAAANACLDALAHLRLSQGLKALTVNWGGWAETGMATGRAVAAQLSHGGSIPPETGLRILGDLLRDGSPEVGVVPFPWALYFEGLPRRLSLLADVERDLAQRAADAAKFASLRVALRSGDDAVRKTNLLAYLEGVVARLLRLDAGEAIAQAQPLVELGLDSLVTIQLRNRLRTDLEIDLPVSEMIQAGSLDQLVEVIGTRLGSGESASAAARIAPLGLAEAPLSFAQHRLWFLAQLDPTSAFYTVTFSLYLEGSLDRGAFEASFAEIVRRHGSLRTRIVVVDGEPVQRIAAEAASPIAFEDLEGLPEAERTARVDEVVAGEAGRAFALDQPSLLRVTLLRLGPQLHRAIVAMHHIITDGWSAVVLMQEFGASYRALVAGDRPALPPLPVQYADFAVWQRDWLTSERASEELDYWSANLSAPLPVLDLPTDRPRTATAMHRGGAFSVMLPPALADGLKGLGRSAGTSLFAALMTGFKILLHRLTGATDLIVGSLVANRDRPEIEGLIGFFSNMVVFRSDLSGDLSVREQLAREAICVGQGLAHQDLPFDRLVEDLQPPRVAGRNPLCDVILVLQRGVPADDLEAGGLRIGPMWDLDNGTVRFDLEIHVWDTDRGLSVSFIYNKDLFDSATVAHIETQFASVLRAMVADPDIALSRVPLSEPDGPRPWAPSPEPGLADALKRIESLSDEEVEALLREMGEEGAESTP
ncbi:type I polyketide synthase [Chelatococcus reniformis]|uniref:Polyketide synthase n=1 Tax=Chelatococcus reniformis TaxID=1494448 RepID=A0A916X817_9HYPH|nr:type I polyketide synthase [Chelatococcus reniformis]GGC48545.1 hypothetical protein GCM10010994_04650 [Chelatococcus reniformis]